MGKTNSEVRTARTRYVFIWAPPRRANITRPELTPTSLESVDRPLVHAGRALPVEHVDQLPRILVEFELHLSLIVERQLRQRKQDAGALALVLIVEVKFACREVEGG